MNWQQNFKLFTACLAVSLLLQPAAKSLAFEPEFLDASAPVSSSISFTSQIPAVVVVKTIQTQQVVVADSSTAYASLCAGASTLSPTHVQDAAVVNFQQPADCFSLRVSEVAVQQELSVAPLASAAYSQSQVVVVRTKVAENTYHAAQTEVPVAPIAATVLFAVILWTRKSRIFENAVRFLRQEEYSFPLTLERLSIMRC